MKTKIITTVAIALMLFIVSSGITKPVNGYLHGGISTPSGKIGSVDIKDIWKTGYSFGGSVGISMIPRVEFLVSYDFHSFSLKNTPLFLFVGSYNTTMYGIGGKVNLGVPLTTFNPYLVGGIGRASFSLTLPVSLPPEIPLDGMDTDTKTFYQFGAGIEFGRFFIQGRYMTMSSGDNKRTYMPITLGFKI